MSKIVLYHGSLVEVSHPLVNVGRKDLDFGQGFYVTDLKEQTIKWANTLKGRTDDKKATACLNIYELEQDHLSDYRIQLFKTYDFEWLDFICRSRRGEHPWKDFDIIEGGIANDSVIDTVDAYMSDLIDAKTALGRLAFHKPNNQICILNQKIIDLYLHFITCKKL
ncbi:MAG: DUF3990 domain-containing protein [Prevotella sp.]|nr:DUF3990 domain-containing protein [Prevotella sp.]